MKKTILSLCLLALSCFADTNATKPNQEVIDRGVLKEARQRALNISKTEKSCKKQTALKMLDIMNLSAPTLALVNKYTYEILNGKIIQTQDACIFNKIENKELHVFLTVISMSIGLNTNILEQIEVIALKNGGLDDGEAMDKYEKMLLSKYNK